MATGDQTLRFEQVLRTRGGSPGTRIGGYALNARTNGDVSLVVNAGEPEKAITFTMSHEEALTLYNHLGEALGVKGE
jgi:hypothetical protein